MLSGEYKHQLDAKYRLRLPAKIREKIGKFVLVRGINGCLFVFNSQFFEEQFADKLKQVPIYDKKYHKAKSSIAALYDEPEEDAQGRFVLMQGFREFAAIGKNVVFVGAIDHLEIWGEERYEQFKKGQLELPAENIEFDTCMEVLSEFRL